jgi:hypothetical protein
MRERVGIRRVGQHWDRKVAAGSCAKLAVEKLDHHHVAGTISGEVVQGQRLT